MQGKRYKAYIFNVKTLNAKGIYKNVLNTCHAIKGINSPYVERCIELIKTEESLIMVTKFFTFMTLDSFIDMHRNIDMRICIKIARGLFDGLNELHKKGVCHCKISPENISLDNKLNPQLGNFGFYSRAFETSSIETQSKKDLIFSPPEMLMDEKEINGMACDVWCMGVIIYMMVENKLPFNHSNNVRIVNNIIHCQYTISPTLNQHLVDVIKSCFVKNPSERGTAFEIAMNLKCAEQAAIKECSVNQISSVMSYNHQLASTSAINFFDYAKKAKVPVRTRFTFELADHQLVNTKNIKEVKSNYF